MSETKVAEISQKIDTLSYDEIVTVISLLVEKLKISFKEPAYNKKADNLEKAFALSDSLHMNSHGKNISREELYDR